MKSFQRQKLANWINETSRGENGFTPVHFAVFNGNIEMLKYFHEYGADFEKINRDQLSNITLLHVAAQGDSPSTMAYIKKMIESKYRNQNKKVDINAKDVRNATPLHWACYAGSENAIQYLAAWGADVNVADMSGLTPLHLSVKSSEEIKSARSVKLLLIKGAKRNVRDDFGRKPIDIALECKFEPIKKEMMVYLVIFEFLEVIKIYRQSLLLCKDA